MSKKCIFWRLKNKDPIMDSCLIDDNNFNSHAPFGEPEFGSVEIVQVYPSGILQQGSQGIVITPAQCKAAGSTQSLEAEVQNIVIQSQNQPARLNSNSVIQSISATGQPVRISSICRNDTLPTENDKINRVMWVPATSNNLNELSESDVLLNKDEYVDADAQIPLTVQDCVLVGKSKNDAQIRDSLSDEEQQVESEIVLDHEPDPDDPVENSEEDSTDMSNRCYMCMKKFKQLKNMYAHVRKVHSRQPLIQGGIVCPLCKMHALRQAHLRSHLETLHAVRIDVEEREFDTAEEFIAWKECVERETVSLYISKSSPKLLATNNIKTYFKCHRSGSFATTDGNQSGSPNKKKNKNPQGSLKIEATCPAAMEVVESMNGVTVTFWSTHIGHSNDASFLPKNANKPTGTSGAAEDSLTLDEPQTSTGEGKKARKGKKDIFLGRRPKKVRNSKNASHALLMEKTDQLFNVIETTVLPPHARPQICVMIDNLISAVKRRAVQKPIAKCCITSKKPVTGGMESEEEQGDEYSTHNESSDYFNAAHPPKRLKRKL